MAQKGKAKNKQNDRARGKDRDRDYDSERVRKQLTDRLHLAYNPAFDDLLRDGTLLDKFKLRIREAQANFKR